MYLPQHLTKIIYSMASVGLKSEDIYKATAVSRRAVTLALCFLRFSISMTAHFLPELSPTNCGTQRHRRIKERNPTLVEWLFNYTFKLAPGREIVLNRCCQ